MDKALHMQLGPLEALVLGSNASLLILCRKLEEICMYILGEPCLKKVRIEQMDYNLRGLSYTCLKQLLQFRILDHSMRRTY
jgi:hypothetical protein